MKRIAIVVAATAAFGFAGPAVTAFADSGPNSPTATNSASCMGTERATRNSNGGDRAQGGFGPAQSAYVASLNASGQNYGQWLQTVWFPGC